MDRVVENCKKCSTGQHGTARHHPQVHLMAIKFCCITIPASGSGYRRYKCRCANLSIPACVCLVSSLLHHHSYQSVSITARMTGSLVSEMTRRVVEFRAGDPRQGNGTSDFRM
mmetsp:Transcript_26560/g.73011  ORF Transcript_26560/g.73011 Transcript_26560/m.73011 type:complete len:113 (+) Transcript_26560:1105-1443(+)